MNGEYGVWDVGSFRLEGDGVIANVEFLDSELKIIGGPDRPDITVMVRAGTEVCFIFTCHLMWSEIVEVVEVTISIIGKIISICHKKATCGRCTTHTRQRTEAFRSMQPPNTRF